MNVPAIERRRVVYQCPFFPVWHFRADFGSYVKEYYVPEFGIRAGLLLVDGDRVLLVRQYRLIINRLSWEVPGGKVDDGESPAEAAVRECVEETGFRACHPKPLFQYQAGLDNLINPSHLFYATEFDDTGRRGSVAHEIHEHQWVPLSKALEMVRTGEIADCFTTLALLTYRLWVA
ncbi:MAG: NUDIX hydrolase [Gemmataceae bacterium]|nr:NUDIX hydrolase [Gemmataceae bacterium]